MPTPTKKQIAAQLQKLRQTGFDVKLASQAGANGFAPEFFFAIASRETNCVNMLGDQRPDGPHGVGIVQIDIQHPIAREARDSGSWKTNPDPLIAFGAQLLADNLRQAASAFPDLKLEDQLKVAASGYNCGMQRAIAGQRQGDSDRSTTGKDYGRDVVARMAIFQQLAGSAAAAAGSGGN